MKGGLFLAGGGGGRWVRREESREGSKEESREGSREVKARNRSKYHTSSLHIHRVPK